MRYRHCTMASLVCGMLVALLPLNGDAQQVPPTVAAGQESPGRVRVTNVRFNYVRTPIYQAVSVPGARSRNEWLQILLEYETAGGARGLDGKTNWVDEITLDWYVGINRGRERPLLLTTSVTYVDLQEGSHNAVVYIRPGVLQRYTGGRRVSTRLIGVHVEARIAAESAAFDQAPRDFPDKWWESRVAEHKPGELLNRLDTPFAPLDYDHFEQIKPIPR